MSWLQLLDYRRRVAAAYAEVRTDPAGEATWRRWRDRRDELFATHPQSALEPEDRHGFDGLPFFPYDPAWRMVVPINTAAEERIGATHSGAGSSPLIRFGVVEVTSPGGERATLDLYWIDVYGGGVFLPFRDTTNGRTTYGGGRYLLDTVKGADLGGDADGLVLDFNYAYHPSCVHSPRWSCPLAPPSNRLPFDVPAGERLAGPVS